VRRLFSEWLYGREDFKAGLCKTLEEVMALNFFDRSGTGGIRRIANRLHSWKSYTGITTRS